MRTLGKNIKIDGAAPTKVSDMKDGELRVTGDTIYGRVGDQILSAPYLQYLGYLHFDEFDDGNIHNAWNSEVHSGDAGSTVTEADGFLNYNMIVKTAIAPEIELFQTGIEGIDIDQGKGVWYFDIWHAVVWPTGLGTADSTMSAHLWYTFSGNGGDDGGGFEMYYNNATSRYYMNAQSNENGAGYANRAASDLSEAEGGHLMWLRLRFLPGDSRIRFFWAHGTDNGPLQKGWTELINPKSNPDPTGHTSLEVRWQALNGNTILPVVIKFDFLGDWLLAPTTTTTTTTTTT